MRRGLLLVPEKIRILDDCQALGCLTICSAMVRSVDVVFSMLVLFRRVGVVLVYSFEVAGIKLVGYWCSARYCPCLMMSSIGVSDCGLSRSRWCLRMILIVCIFGRLIVRGFSGIAFCVNFLSVSFHIWSRFFLRLDRVRTGRYCLRSFRGKSPKIVLFDCGCYRSLYLYEYVYN